MVPDPWQQAESTVRGLVWKRDDIGTNIVNDDGLISEYVVEFSRHLSGITTQAVDRLLAG
jgi:hypothetical protein